MLNKIILLLRKAGLFSVGIAMLICILSYLQESCPYPLFDTLEKYSWVQRFKYIDEQLMDDVMLVSTSNDQELIETQVGNTAIADRNKLVTFLKKAESSHYKLILFDILFEEEYKSEHDTLLGAVLSRIPRLIIVRGLDIKGRPTSLQYEDKLKDKTAYNSYYYPFFNVGFSRYQFIQEGNPSAALRMYNILDNGFINNHCLFSTSNKHLCKAAPIITLTNNMRSVEPNGSFSITNCNIGKDYLDRLSTDSLSKLMNDKIIIISDFDNDVHDSYVGKIPGSFIALASYEYLKTGKHLITYKYTLLFILYFVLCILIISNTSVKIHNRLHDKHFGLLIVSFIGYSLILSVISVLIYFRSRIIISIFVPSLIFSIISKAQECGIRFYKS